MANDRPEQKREPWNPLLCNYPDSEKVNKVSLSAEPLFTRLIARSDDNANYWGSPKMLLCHLFAKRFEKGEVSERKLKAWRDELVRENLIKLYQIEGTLYLHIINCKKHLRSDMKPDIRFPQITPEATLTICATSPDTDSDTTMYPPTTTTTTATTTIYMSKAKDAFDLARKIYPSTKRGLDTEFENFRKKHKDWQQVLPLLEPAIQVLIHDRKKKLIAQQHDKTIHVPPWKNFKTWINQRCWEEAANV